MPEDFTYRIVSVVPGVIVMLIIFVACFRYFIRNKNIIGYLFLVGGILTPLLKAVVSLVSLSAISVIDSSDPELLRYAKVSDLILNVINIVGRLCFAFGFYKLIKTTIIKKTQPAF